RCLKPGDTRASELPFRALRWVGGGGTQEAPDSAASLLLDHRENLWLGNVGRGIYRVDLAAAEIHPAFGPAEVQSRLLVPLALREDGRGRIWAATNRGLACREEDGRWRLFRKAQGLKYDGVHGLAQAGDGSLWIYYYYESFGLDRVAYENGRFAVREHLGTADRLVSDTVFSALRDRAGALWVGTNRGLDRFEGGNYLHLGQGQGLVGEDCWANAICQAADGDLWQGTSNGLVQILAGRRPPPLPTPRVFIQQVIQGKNTLFPPFARLPAVAHRDATLEFWFSAPTYVDEISVRYQVRMIGLEEEWRTTDVHQARFVALPGGRYRFEVRAAYAGGPYGPVAAFEVQVRPPWWRSWWFVFLELVSAAGLMGGIVKWRLRALARQKNRLQTLVAEQTRDLQKANLALAEANRALEALSLTDSLTGLHNRRYLAMVIDDNVAQTMRAYRDGGPVIRANQDLTFFMVDIDHFKQINDRFGHGVGDQVLLRVAGTLRHAARESDAVIRWGGEEFLLVARNSSRAEAPSMAERIRSLVACQCLELPSGQTVRWTCSVGFAAFPFLPQALDWLGWEEVVDIADACLYGAKESGRDAWVGVQAGEGCDPARHGPRVPHDLRSLAREGALRVFSSRSDPFGRAEEADGSGAP
ncbi:MAG TPA: diguanylate cyclase, partial [Candidatus Aminicenantes bacterium]|nr:diguanylate cyclase [Candidatus Aminicenantes bacterium]